MKKRLLSFGSLLLLCVAPMFAQVATVSAHDSIAVEVHRAAALTAEALLPQSWPLETVHYSNTVEVVARHKDGREFYRHKSHNLLTNAGKDVISSAVSNTGTQAAACNYIALTNTAITPAAGDTTLSGEIAANGLSRAQATYAHTNGTNTYTLTKVFTATATQASQAAGVFNASSAGSMCFENTYTSVTLNNGDTLTVTWTITLT
jgi:hypothetical protein